jgi:hypothetical protein
MIVVGIVLGQAFFARSKKRLTAQKTPLLAMELLGPPHQRSGVFSMFIIIVLGSAVSFRSSVSAARVVAYTWRTP